mmetsp:Transcript_32318/g.89281  ORF Transcript_32318/g.89281 Transcript_32318/m.89281 type:complete len:313 (+) Transcript_32318:446-1384(+)
MSEAEILAVDGVHHGLSGAAVEHAHVQTSEHELVVEVLSGLGPEVLVHVALPKVVSLHEAFIGFHARGRRHVVALELADQGIEHDPCQVSCLSQEDLRAVDQGVLVRAVERVPCLEGNRLLPPALCHHLAASAGRINMLREGPVVTERQQADRAADELGTLVGSPQSCSRVIDALGAIHLGHEERLVPIEHGFDHNFTKDLPVVDEGGKLPGLQARRFGRGHGQGQRYGPRPATAVALDVRAVEDALVVRHAHRPGQRAESTVRYSVEGRPVRLGDLDPRRVAEVREALDDPVDGRIKASVDWRRGASHAFS